MSASEGGDTDVSDPVASSFYKEVWMKQASLNTVVFEKVFKCVPTDTVRSFNELKVRRGILSVIPNIQAHVVVIFSCAGVSERRHDGAVASGRSLGNAASESARSSGHPAAAISLQRTVPRSDWRQEGGPRADHHLDLSECSYSFNLQKNLSNTCILVHTNQQYCTSLLMTVSLKLVDQTAFTLNISHSLSESCFPHQHDRAFCLNSLILSFCSSFRLSKHYFCRESLSLVLVTAACLMYVCCTSYVSC